MAKLGFLAFAAIILLTGFGSANIPVYAQEGMTQSTDSLDILLEPQWSADSTKFKVSFLEPGTDTIHQHQDYNFVILQDGKEVFNAAEQIGQSAIHNAEGTITVPYKFQQDGDYVVQVLIYGLGLPAIPTDESVEFSVSVTPEFPTGVLVASAAIGIGVIAARRKL
jgi:hypothetical protein